MCSQLFKWTPGGVRGSSAKRPDRVDGSPPDFDAHRSSRFGAGWFPWLVFLLLLVWVVSRGLVPAFQAATGDFANYHTSARILLGNEPLERAYWSFPWFQKQMDLSGVQDQMGGFIPHPPPMALLMMPLAGFVPVYAKSIWIAASVLLAIGAALLLTRISGLPRLLTGILLLSTGGALINNLLFGQVYLLVLFLIVLGLYLEQQDHPFLSGLCFGGQAAMKYLGLAWLLYFAFKGRRRVVLGGLAALCATALMVVWLDGIQVFMTFFKEVFNRLVAGEIQDPYSTRWQSWNSLFRRLFLFEQTLNPSPAFDSPPLFFAAKNLILWLFSGLSVLVIAKGKSLSKKHDELLRLGWIPLSLLLLSPGGATYHVLLLTISAVFFTRILLDSQRSRWAVVLWLLLLGINLPHHIWLERFVGGWSTVLVYSRLGLLLLYFVLSLVFLPKIPWRYIHRGWILFTLVIALGLGTWQLYRYQKRAADGAVWLAPRGPEFDRHFGLLLDSPDLGSEQTVFSYGELLDDSYSIYSLDGRRWTPPSTRNYYDPDLHHDDESLLMGSAGPLGQEVLLSVSRGSKPEFLIEGSDPSWAPDGRSFTFLNQGRAYLYLPAERRAEPLPAQGDVFDIQFSPAGDALVYCSRNGMRFRLARLSLADRRDEQLLDSSERLQGPGWSPDGFHILFSWGIEGNQDVWVIDPASKALRRLTSHPGNDENPVWDRPNRRILFVSDRGRGLQFGTLYWIPVPEELRQ